MTKRAQLTLTLNGQKEIFLVDCKEAAWVLRSNLIALHGLSLAQTSKCLKLKYV